MSQRSQEYPEIDFSEIKRWLEKEDLRALEKDHHISRKHLSVILSGKKRNMEVVKMAIERATLNKARIVSAMERLKRIEDP